MSLPCCGYCHQMLYPDAMESICRQGLLFCDNDCYTDYKDRNKDDSRDFEDDDDN
jgi:hypothetical protein